MILCETARQDKKFHDDGNVSNQTPASGLGILAIFGVLSPGLVMIKSMMMKIYSVYFELISCSPSSSADEILLRPWLVVSAPSIVRNVLGNQVECVNFQVGRISNIFHSARQKRWTTFQKCQAFTRADANKSYCNKFIVL